MEGETAGTRWREFVSLKLVLGPALFGLVLLLGPGDDPKIARMAAVAVWMAAWWVTEAVPIPVTALLPLVLMPVLGITPVAEVAPNYGRSTVYLFLGGFLLALGLQASGVHRRMALAIVHAVGGQPRRIVLGFMLASAFLSMWISNTATVMVLMPIGLSVIAAVKDRGASGKPLTTLAVTILLFIIPSRDRPGKRMLEWSMAAQVPWGMLLLFGGGFALAAGFGSSGLSRFMGERMAGLEGLNPYLVIVIVCVALTFLTELTSNTATTELVLPILASAAVGIGLDPRGLMIPATLSASCAFMMPVASPTQAIVFASGYVPIRDMVRAGIWFNIVGVILVAVVFFLLAGPVMGIDFHEVPAWAKP